MTGTSWAAYLTRLRIDYACRLLRETSRSIVSTAFECGYDDLSIFYRAFRAPHRRDAPRRVARAVRRAHVRTPVARRSPVLAIARLPRQARTVR